jgi:hypothetical protein
VILLDNPRLENRTEDELTLWVHPNNVTQGWISGIYPEIVVGENQRFAAWVGCLADSKGCNVTFRLDYLDQNGVVKNLGSWREVFDGNVTKIDLDLFGITGKQVQFILTVEARGDNPERANAFWFVPAILQGTAPEPTPTAIDEIPTPTQTATEESSGQ